MYAHNVNCGVLGHVDSGKTSLCKTLAVVASTASMDKHPESQARGITIDLGFSSFMLPSDSSNTLDTQVTLVDCPGHSSLIRTVLGGSRIMDLCMLVVDAKKGFQVQTAECLVIAEIVTSKLLVVVNKMDMIEPSNIPTFKGDMEKKIRTTLQKTAFGQSFSLVFVSAITNEGIADLTNKISDLARNQLKRNLDGPLHIAYDHAFSVKGKGTVFTGTVLSGSIQRGGRVYFPYSMESAEVRTIEKFRQNADRAIQGDRIGICVPRLIPSVERGDIYFSADDLITNDRLVFLVDKIRFYKMNIENGSKLHISFGHTHCMGTVYLFTQINPISEHREASQVMINTPVVGESLLGRIRGRTQLISADSIMSSRFELIDDSESARAHKDLFCLILLSKQIRCLPGSAMIASKLDLDSDYQGCRLALYGLHVDFPEEYIATRVIKTKRKEGVIERPHMEGSTYLVRGLLKKGGSDPDRFINRTIHHSQSGIPGRILSTFGKSGLLKVEFDEVLPDPVVGTKIHLTIEKPALSKILASR